MKVTMIGMGAVGAVVGKDSMIFLEEKTFSASRKEADLNDTEILVSQSMENESTSIMSLHRKPMLQTLSSSRQKIFSLRKSLYRLKMRSDLTQRSFHF